MYIIPMGWGGVESHYRERFSPFYAHIHGAGSILLKTAYYDVIRGNKINRVFRKVTSALHSHIPASVDHRGDWDTGYITEFSLSEYVDEGIFSTRTHLIFRAYFHFHIVFRTPRTTRRHLGSRNEDEGAN